MAFCFILSDCLFARPDWITGESKKYPYAKYLTGVGIGSNLESARENARAEISKIFSAKVQQIFFEATREQTEKGKTSWSSMAESSIKVSVEDVIEGVMLPRSWHDKKGKKYYALAVLEKAKYKRYLSGLILDLTSLINSYVSKANSSDSVFETLRNLSEAKKLSERLVVVSLRKTVVDDAPFSGIGLNLSPDSIAKRSEEVRSGTVFRVITEGEQPLRTENAISSQLTKIGFIVGDSIEGKKQVVLKTQLRIAPVKRAQTAWKFYNWSGNYGIEEAGRLVFSDSLSGSESHPDDSSAKEKALSAAINGVIKSIESRLTEY